MGNFDRPRSFGGGDRGRGNSGFGGRGGFGGGRSFGGRDSGRFERRPVEMHDATCDKCKKQCQVPFRPSGDKPVLCSDCFRNAGSDNSFGSRDRGRSSSSGVSSGMTSDQFKVINVKLDKILNVLSTLEIADDEDGEDLEIVSDEESSEDSDADSESENDKDLNDNADDDLDDSEDEPKIN